MRKRPIILHRPAPAQDIQTILDVILQFINVIEAIYRVIANIFGLGA